MTAVLAAADSDLQFVEVLRQVELLLGGPVAYSSVKNSLKRGAEHDEPRFDRVGHGRYQLRRPNQNRLLKTLVDGLDAR